MKFELLVSFKMIIYAYIFVQRFPHLCIQKCHMYVRFMSCYAKEEKLEKKESKNVKIIYVKMYVR